MQQTNIYRMLTDNVTNQNGKQDVSGKRSLKDKKR